MRGLIQTPDQIQQRRLARTRRSHDGDPLAGIGREVDVIDSAHGGRTTAVHPRNTREFDERAHSPLRITAGCIFQIRAVAIAVATVATTSITAPTPASTRQSSATRSEEHTSELQ